MSEEAPSNQELLHDFRWLIGPEGDRWMKRAEEDGRAEPAVAKSLRRELSEQRTHLVLEQVELRRRGRLKFADAQRMFFTRLALEQATDQVVAAHKAGRFPPGDPCTDLCCGIGGDLLALAGRGPAVGVERDRVAALLASENLRRLGHGEASVAAADATAWVLHPAGCWHLDPDRRNNGRRSTQLRWHSPDQAGIERLLASSPHAAVKLAPAAEVPTSWQPRAECQWISRNRECRQLIVWFGRLAEAEGQRRATILRSDALDGVPEVQSLSGRPGKPREAADKVLRYVFEPDAAVLAADLTGALAQSLQLQVLSVGGVYLTADRPIADLGVACFEVQDILPLDRKRLRRLLADRRIGRLEIKQRGLSEDPERLRRQLQLRGEAAAVLILTRLAGTVQAIVARRVQPRELSPPQSVQ